MYFPWSEVQKAGASDQATLCLHGSGCGWNKSPVKQMEKHISATSRLPHADGTVIFELPGQKYLFSFKLELNNVSAGIYSVRQCDEIQYRSYCAIASHMSEFCSCRLRPLLPDSTFRTCLVYVRASSSGEYLRILNQECLTDSAAVTTFTASEFSTNVSDGVKLVVQQLPVFEGHSLYLQCKFTSILKKYVTFYKDDMPIPSAKMKKSGNVFEIKVNSPKDSGLYHCAAGNDASDAVNVQVQELFSKPTLKIEPVNEILEGQSLNLICAVQAKHVQLQYSFYKNDTCINYNDVSKYKYKVAASLSDSGTYHCEANSLSHGLKKKSDEVSISVKEIFSKPVLKVESGEQLFEGQQLNLTCLVEIFRSNSLLTYTFSKDRQTLMNTAEYDYYTRERVGMDDSGIYICEATDLNGGVKKLSNRVGVSVRRIPLSKPRLAIQPGNKLIEGDVASFTCSVSKGSTPITYAFYKNRNKELYWETTNLTMVTHGIIEVNKSSEGNYSCCVANEWTNDSLQSNFEWIAVIVPVSGAFLISNMNTSEISTGTRLVLQCLVRTGTAPQFHWYLNSQKVENFSDSYHLNIDGSKFIINSFKKGQGGRYHCVATNNGIDGAVFNISSNYIDVTFRAHSYAAIITPAIITILLLSSSMIALFFIKIRKKSQGTSSSVSLPEGETSASRSQPLNEDASAINFGQFRAAKNNDATKTDVNLVYSLVSMAKTHDVGIHGGKTGCNQNNREGHNEYFVTYATLHHGMKDNHLEVLEMEEGDVYENLPRSY
ncbi:Fc receptor-like protein 3 [Mustelus asterias]